MWPNVLLILPEDRCDAGVIARISIDPLGQSIARHSLPTENVSWNGTRCCEFPKVISAPQACGRVAAEFYISNGFE